MVVGSGAEGDSVNRKEAMAFLGWLPGKMDLRTRREQEQALPLPFRKRP